MTQERNTRRFASFSIEAARCMIFTLAVAGLSAADIAGAQGLPQTDVSNIGSGSGVRHTFEPDERFWREYVPEKSNGQITVQRSTYDVLGIPTSQILRVLMSGVVDFAASDISQVAGDDPVFEGCDLAGMALDIETARRACQAWKPVIDRQMQAKFSVKLLAMGANPPQVIWCRDEIKQLADLKGRKIRVFNKTMTDFVSAVGGTTITMNVSEVVTSLQQGVIDCAVTGTTSGNSFGLPEVTDYIYPMYLGWAANFQAVNLDSWNRFAPEVQEFFLEGFKVLEEDMWATTTKSTLEADNCNTNKDPCTLGTKVEMTIVPVTDSDRTLHKELMETVVLVEWAKRCGKECATEWNDTVGKVVGMQIPLENL
jgi:TRAP-type C4-dicarboxylate transport system substrate-binding protein